MNEDVEKSLNKIESWMEAHDRDERKEWQRNTKRHEALVVHIAESKAYNQAIIRMDETINGNGKTGLKEHVRRNSSVLRNITRFLWLVAGAIIVAVAGILVV